MDYKRHTMDYKNVYTTAQRSIEHSVIDTQGIEVVSFITVVQLCIVVVAHLQ